MARMVKILPLKYRADDGSGFTYLQIKYHGPDRDAFLQECVLWLRDKARPGLFIQGQKWDDPWYNNPAVYDWAITDPRVAMEFKMRFG